MLNSLIANSRIRLSKIHGAQDIEARSRESVINYRQPSHKY